MPATPSPGTARPPTPSIPPPTSSSSPRYTLLTEEQLKDATAAAAAGLPLLQHARPGNPRRGSWRRSPRTSRRSATNSSSAPVSKPGCPAARLQGERARTTGQLRLFAGVVRQGDFRGVRIDPALPDRSPLPRADIRQRQIPLGPSPSSVPATSRWPSRRRAATPPPPSPPAAPWSSRPTTPTPAPANSSDRPSPRPSRTWACTPACSR